MTKRLLPPLTSDVDRIQTGRIAADRIYAELRERELIRSLWTELPPGWEHFIDSAGAITSWRQP